MSSQNANSDFRIEVGIQNFDFDRIHRWLSTEAYWSPGVSRETVEKALRNSIFFGVFSEKLGQVAVARVITDGATFSYLADVFVDNSARGQGIGKMLMDAVTVHPELQGLRRQMLATSDAHTLYERYGYKMIQKPEILMEKLASTPDS